MGEPVETSLATWQHTDSEGAVAMVPVPMSEVSDARLVIHPRPLFGPTIPFKRDAPFSSGSSASLLNNPMYNIKLARSVVLVLDRQFIIKRSMGTNLSDLIDLSLKVNIVMVCSLFWEKSF